VSVISKLIMCKIDALASHVFMPKIARVESVSKDSALIRPRPQLILITHAAKIAMHHAVNATASHASQVTTTPSGHIHANSIA
jgi:hypothetical protein